MGFCSQKGAKNPTKKRFEDRNVGEALEQEHHEKVFQEIKARYSALTDEELAEYLRLTRIINDTLENEKIA